MDTATLRLRISQILNEEEHSVVDWNVVQELCVKLADDLSVNPNPDCPHIVHHFLSDADIRQKDFEYGRHQRIEIWRFAETGECEDSKSISGRGCFTVLAVGLGAFVVWWRT